MEAKSSCCKAKKCDKKKTNCGFNNACFIIVLYFLLAIILAGVIYY